MFFLFLLKIVQLLVLLATTLKKVIKNYRAEPWLEDKLGFLCFQD